MVGLENLNQTFLPSDYDPIQILILDGFNPMSSGTYSTSILRLATLITELVLLTLTLHMRFEVITNVVALASCCSQMY